MKALAFRLLGHRIGYSASPAMMRAAFAALRLPHTYDLADVPDADGQLGAALEALRGDDFGGANVTTPHKRSVAAQVDLLAESSQRSGSVNTVVRDGGRLIGHDTDTPALAEAIRRLRPDGPGQAVVLGGGGAARAAAQALTETRAAGIALARRSDGSWGRLAELLADADVVVNATPVGTDRSAGPRGPAQESPLPAALLRADLAVLDLVYRPSPTRLVREAREAGAAASGGAGVLLGQGCRSLELWLGVPPPVEAMRAALREALGPDADV